MHFSYRCLFQFAPLLSAVCIICNQVLFSIEEGHELWKYRHHQCFAVVVGVCRVFFSVFV